MLGKEFFETLSKDPETMKQAEHIWKMLDEMAENDPNKYSSFIKQNIESGAKEFNSKKEKIKQNPNGDTKPVSFKEQLQEKLLEQNIQQILKKDDKPKKILIEEISESQVSKVPEYELEELNNCYQLIIYLPEVEKFQEIDLNLSIKQVQLLVPQKYEFKLSLKQAVNNNQPDAKWDKKNKKLKIKLNFL